MPIFVRAGPQKCPFSSGIYFLPGSQPALVSQTVSLHHLIDAILFLHVGHCDESLSCTRRMLRCANDIQVAGEHLGLNCSLESVNCS